MASPAPLTDLIQLAQSGDDAALKLVFAATYEDLHRMARSRIRQSGGGTMLDTTALVHESFLRFRRVRASSSSRTASTSFAMPAM